MCWLLLFDYYYMLKFTINESVGVYEIRWRYFIGYRHRDIGIGRTFINIQTDLEIVRKGRSILWI